MPIHFKECGWEPNTVVRAIAPVRSSTQVVFVESDKGEAYLKGIGNPAGNESLAFELVGTRLAKAAGLFVPDYAVIDHDLLEITRHDGGVVGHGPAFLSRGLPGNTGGASPEILSRLMNPYDIPLLVCFDTWVANTDRFPPNDYYHQEPSWDNIFFVPIGEKLQMTVFDHTHCFSEDDFAASLESHAYRDDPRVFGAFPEFLEYCDEDSLRRAARSIQSVDDAEIERVVRNIPPEWGITAAMAEAWQQEIIERRGLVEAIVLDHLVPQRVMEFGSHGG